jgi:hypothetical protein
MDPKRHSIQESVWVLRVGALMGESQAGQLEDSRKRRAQVGPFRAALRTPVRDVGWTSRSCPPSRVPYGQLLARAWPWPGTRLVSWGPTR